MLQALAGCKAELALAGGAAMNCGLVQQVLRIILLGLGFRVMLLHQLHPT